MSRPKNRSGPENPDGKTRSPDSGESGDPQDDEAKPGKPRNGPYPPDLDHYLVDAYAERRFIYMNSCGS